MKKLKKRKPNIKIHQSLNRKYELLRLTYKVYLLYFSGVVLYPPVQETIIHDFRPFAEDVFSGKA